jgi:hypothetical protein
MKNITIAAIVALIIGSMYWAVSSGNDKREARDAKRAEDGIHKIQQSAVRGSRIYEIEFDGHKYVVVETYRGIGITKK